MDQLRSNDKATEISLLPLKDALKKDPCRIPQLLCSEFCKSAVLKSIASGRAEMPGEIAVIPVIPVGSWLHIPRLHTET